MPLLITASHPIGKPPEPVDAAPAPDRRLRRQSTLLSWVFAAALVLTGLIAALEIGAILLRAGSVAGIQNGSFAFVLDLPPFSTSEPLSRAFVPISTFGVWQSLLAAALLSLRLLPGLVILASLHSLFRTYASGVIFAHGNTIRIRRIGWALLGYAAVPLLTHAALFAAGMSAVAFKLLEARQVDAAAAGAVVFAVAHIMSFGSAIESDRESIV